MINTIRPSALVLLALPLLGCPPGPSRPSAGGVTIDGGGSSGGTMPAPPPAACEGIQPAGHGGGSSGFDRFYAYEPPAYTPAGPAPSLPVALDEVAVPDSLAEYGLDAAAKDVLARNGFVVVNGPAVAGQDKIPEVYQALQQRDLPIFVTADTALHLYHLAFDTLLMTIEEQKLVPLLVEMMQLVRAQAALVPVRDLDAMAEAADGVIAVCDVVLRLLGESPPADAHSADLVEAEVALIEGRAGVATSPIFGYDEDYSQYIPRGHYTRTPALTRYFKAMMWIGRMSYLFKATTDPEPPGVVGAETARRHARMAALLAEWLDEGRSASSDNVSDPRSARDMWSVIYRVTAFFAGFSDDLTPEEVLPVVRDFLGAGNARQLLDDDAQVDLLRARMAALRDPRIYSGTASGAVGIDVSRAGDPAALLEVVAGTVGMRLMGQRYAFDTDVMSHLTFPGVGRPTALADPAPFTLVSTDSGPIRGFSRGLDLFAVLGAPRARPILDELRDGAYEQFDDALAAACAVLPAAGAAWHESLYASWLEALRDYVAPRAQPTQPFELSEAWADRTLTAALASWAQLRHDTILYTKQPYVVMTTSVPREPPPPPPPKGFVEPHPELFARLVSLNEMTRAGLEDLGVLPEAAGEVLRDFGDVLGTLRDLAIGELEDRAIDERANEFLGSFGERCAALVDRIAALNVPPDTSAEMYSRGESAVDTRTTLVADVMTNVQAGEVLEEGTGSIEALVAAVRVPGRDDVVLAAGPVLTYYEFRWPLTDRLTDEKWRTVLASDDAPPPPPWVSSFRSGGER
ncbi:MAG: DUF3160 domain-containing protein [Deltaproteobacteria bacterium]|nr:DUF3160 domain-containing protein [Deltaproteobacteria bacterium]